MVTSSWMEWHGAVDLMSDSSHGPFSQTRIFNFCTGMCKCSTRPATMALNNDFFRLQNNFVRCLMGAAAVSFIEPLVNAVGSGWAFTLLAGIVAVLTPSLTLLEIKKGPEWRNRRMAVPDAVPH